MTNRTIYITERDKERLEELILVAEEFSGKHPGDLAKLSNELAVARILSSGEIPVDVVTMNTKVELSYAGTGEKLICTLVFPKDAPADENNLSVLAPVGMAILGYAEGDTVTWDVPSGRCSIKIEKVLYQPEASGNYDL